MGLLKSVIFFISMIYPDVNNAYFSLMSFLGKMRKLL